MGRFLRKNYLLRWWGWLSLLNCIGALTLSLLLKVPPRKLEPLFIIWGFFFLRLLIISINLPYIHAWNTVFMPGLVLLVAAWNCWIRYKNGYVGLLVLPLLCLEPLAHRRNVASLSRFCRYYFGRCSSKLAELVSLSYSQGRSTRYSDRLHDFSVTIPRCYKDFCVHYFLEQLDSWNSFPIECFPLTYDLSGFESIIKRHLLTLGFF